MQEGRGREEPANKVSRVVQGLSELSAVNARSSFCPACGAASLDLATGSGEAKDRIPDSREAQRRPNLTEPQSGAPFDRVVRGYGLRWLLLCRLKFSRWAKRKLNRGSREPSPGLAGRKRTSCGVEPPSLQFCPGVMLYAEIGCDWAVILVSDGVSLSFDSSCCNWKPSAITHSVSNMFHQCFHSSCAHRAAITSCLHSLRGRFRRRGLHCPGRL
jgi:hypothetical protein